MYNIVLECTNQHLGKLYALTYRSMGNFPIVAILGFVFVLQNAVAWIQLLPPTKRITWSQESTSRTFLRASQLDYDVLTTQSQKLSREVSTSETSSLQRALQLARVVSTGMLAPFSVTVLKTGLPHNENQWDEFWSEENLADRFTLTVEELGPTAVKFGQSLSSRPDIVPRRLAKSLQSLQDKMQPFDTKIAKRIIQKEIGSINPRECESILSTLSQPVAAASIGCVYSGMLSDGRRTAIKVQRPGIAQVVEQDSKLLLQLANILESPRINGKRLIQTDLVGAVEEFMNRLREELDYRNEARNLETFASLYSHRRNSSASSTPSDIQVVVPYVYSDLCTSNVLVMEWIDGAPLVDLETEQSRRESYDLILQGIDCTFSQLLETGIMHADPHGGNLFKVSNPPESPMSPGIVPRLGYVDFGLMATIPNTVRDGLVCAVAELVFERNATAVANLFGELALIPDSVLDDPKEMHSLGIELKAALDEVLVYPEGTGTSSQEVPNLRFDKLLNVLSRLVPAFQFKLPPYFLNNARALATLEGMAREIDPQFNVLRFLYPYALNRIVINPSGSPVVTETLNHLITDRISGRIDRRKLRRLLRDMSLLTGFSRRKVLRDLLRSKNGVALVGRILKAQLPTARRHNEPNKRHQHPTRRSSSSLSSTFFRL